MSNSFSVTIRPAELTDVPAITDIYNEAILTTTASFDTETKTMEDRTKRFQAHDERHPILVAVADGKVVGWASLTQWSDRRAYDDTAETSIEEARRLRFHTLIARMAETSHESIHLNKSFDFVHVGTLKEVGRRFGKLLSVHIMQKILD